MSKTNDVTLFSNGIGHFRRVYSIPKGTEEKISIPFKRDHIGDVAASLQVFGSVRLNSPASFTPMNANATALRIDPKDSYKSLLRNLSGAQVTIQRASNPLDRKYTLLGLDEETRISHGSQSDIIDYHLVLRDGISVIRLRLSEVTSLIFDEEAVRTEIDKALKTNFQLIKPDSTLMELSLSALAEDTEAMVQYTIPVAAWKMRYAIREDNGRFTLEGAAIIDNNTDEDWDNFRVSVVTGNPISFSTDIANVVMPQRKQIKLVDSESLGNVYVEEGVTMRPQAEPIRGGARTLSMASCSPKFSTANYSQAGFPSDDGLALQQLAAGDGSLECCSPLEVAEAPGVDSREVGDFCVFTSKEPITILARKSAVVPMFSVQLSKAGAVLLYRESAHSRRPYRAVKFKNESEYSLGKGKTVIYNEGIFSGECVLEATKPGENRMLPHCLENGVKIVREAGKVECRRSAVKISNGVAVVDDVRTCSSVYSIENKKDESFTVALEHTNVLGGDSKVLAAFDGVKILDQEKLVSGNGYRVYFELAPKQSLKLTVDETWVLSTSTMVGGEYGFFNLEVLNSGASLLEDKQVKACIKIYEQIEDVNRLIAEAKNNRNDLKSQIERVRENIAAAKDVANSAVVANWVADLDASEQQIRSIDKAELPALNKRLKEHQAKLYAEVKKISAEWRAK